MTDLSKIRLLVTDVDGCWTDGTVLTDAAGNEWLRYSKRDGVLLPAMREAGIEVVALTSEQKDGPHRARAAKLGIEIHRTSPDGKLADLVRIASGKRFRSESEWATAHGRGIMRWDEIGPLMVPAVPLSEVAYLGDDLPDLPCLETVRDAGGAAFSPYGSVAHTLYRETAEARNPAGLWEADVAVNVTRSRGGEGALRDVCTVLLAARGYDLTAWPVRKARD